MTSSEVIPIRKNYLKIFRYVITLCVIAFAVSMFLYPYERIFTGLLTLSLSFVMLIQFIEFKTSNTEPEKEIRGWMSIVAFIMCLFASIYIFSTLK
ncbi:hypothetical protein GCM10010912_06280 [Paenibacillus albidus]|uniref:Uncharacterized protein n=1 Tax=Paenibacillus albidus TaxID=2041023 RepID=A0A917FBR5_9BACL|nr:hypothetical protein GCM10010912_06280 [Paenibacillus albidus]